MTDITHHENPAVTFISRIFTFYIYYPANP